MSNRFYPTRGKPATIVISAYNAAQSEIDSADIQCDGSADSVQVAAAIAALPAHGGKIQLTSGTFNFAAHVHLGTVGPVVIEGMGPSTVISFDSTTVTGAAFLHDSGTAAPFYLKSMKFIDTASPAQQSFAIVTGWSDSGVYCKDIVVEDIECEECGIWIGAVKEGRATIHNCYVHDITVAGDRAMGAAYCSRAIITNNVIYNVVEMGITGSSNDEMIVANNIIIDANMDVVSSAIDTNGSESVIITGNYIHCHRTGILSEATEGNVVITGNEVVGNGLTTGSGIQVWNNVEGGSAVARVVIANNNVYNLYSGIVAGDTQDATITGNKVRHIGQSGIRVYNSCTGSWQAGRYFNIADNDISDFSAGTPYGYGVLAGSLDYVEIRDNNIDGNNNTNCRGIGFNGTQATKNSRILNNTIRNINASVLYTVPADVEIRGNYGWIGTGEMKTAAGSLTAGSANAFTFAWQNTEIRPVLIWSGLVNVTTSGGSPSATLDVGSAATGTAAASDMLSGADLGTTAAYSLQIAKIGTGNYVTGQILDNNALTLAGSYYIQYMGI